MNRPQNLMDGLIQEMNRVRELITQYDRLPNGVGVFGSTTMKQFIKEAEESMVTGNIVQMVLAYDNLKSCE